MTEAAAPRSAHLERPPSLSGDERLARRAAAGDQRAFAAIYRRYQEELYRFCLAIVGNSQDAQDALQNTMVQALRALPGEERQVKLKPWLYRVARNEAINVIRRRPATPELDPDRLVSSEATADSVETRERLRGLLADLRELPERQRAALVMRELAGLDFAEIGAAFDTSAAVARQTVYEARLGLREMESGREMTCAEAKQEISGADGRVLRRREIRAHLRACEDCRAFRDAIVERRGEFAAIAPLPAMASAGVLHAVLGGSSAAGGGTLAGAGTAGTVAGKAMAASALAKSAAAVALIAAGVVAADRSGMIETPIPGGSSGASSPNSSSAVESASQTGPAATFGPGAGRRGSSPGPTGNRAAVGDGAKSGPEGGSGKAGAAGNPPRAAGELPPAAAHGQSTPESHGGGRSNAHSHSAGHVHGAGNSQKAAHSHGGARGGRSHSTGKGASQQHPSSSAHEGRSEHPAKQGSAPSHGAAPEIAPDKEPRAPLQPPKSQSNQGGAAEGERPAS